MEHYVEIFSDNWLSCCSLCPRMCRADRRVATGFCGCGVDIQAARAALHKWEEPCISGIRGSGTVFFTGCTLRCCFCQNHAISRKPTGKILTPRQLADIFLWLQEEGAHNINLVTPTQYLPKICQALDLVRSQLTIPVVYNCGGYERVETIAALKDYVDIWLPDFKYQDSHLSMSFSGVSDYFDCASKAIVQMIAQTGPPKFHTETASFSPAQSEPASSDSTFSSILEKGVIIRHMVLPGHKDDSIRLLHWMAENLPKNSFLISLLSQYTPIHKNSPHPELNRTVTSYEYKKVADTALSLGLDQGYIQKKSSAREEYTPLFHCQGLSPQEYGKKI